MTTLTLTDIQTAVLRLMDENGGNAQFMAGSATTEMKDIIEQVAEDAIRKIHLQAPVAMLDGKYSDSLATENVLWSGDRYMCRVMLPADFFRLIRVKMESWVKPVSQLQWEDSANYALQANKYRMGTYQKPAAFLIHRFASKYMELFSSPSLQDTLDEFIYLETPVLKNDSIKVCDRLKDASMMQIAADTLVVLGETERAQMMAAMAERVLNTYGGMERHYPDNGNRVEK